MNEWLNPEIGDKSIVFEVFTSDREESNALRAINSIERSVGGSAKNVVRKLLGEKGVKFLKKLLRKG